MRNGTQFGLTKHHHGVVMLLQQLGVDWTLLEHSDSTYDVLILPPNETDRRWKEASDQKPTIDFSGILATEQGVDTHIHPIHHLLDTPWLQPVWDIPIHPLTARAYSKGQSLQKSIWVDEVHQTCHIGLPYWTQSQQCASWMAAMAMERQDSPSSHRPMERIHQTPYSLMRHVLRFVMIQACQWSGQPLMRKSYFPEGVNNIFIFRVDSDYGTKNAVQSLIQTCRSYELPATWFLHTQAHKGWLDMFLDPWIEPAVHGVRHQSRGSTEALLRNILQSKADIERETGLVPTGLAMPFGRYTPQVSDVYKQVSRQFNYASDFGFDSDNVPHWPHAQEPLQLPIHPICPGSFRRTKATNHEIQRYFQRKWSKAQERGEPFIFYHHPMQDDAGVLHNLFQNVSELKSKGHVETWTMKEWAEWWVHRSLVMPNSMQSEEGKWRVNWVQEDSLPQFRFEKSTPMGSYMPLSNPIRQWKSTLLDELGQRTQ